MIEIALSLIALVVAYGILRLVWWRQDMAKLRILRRLIAQMEPDPIEYTKIEDGAIT